MSEMKDGGLAFAGHRHEMLKAAGKEEKVEVNVVYAGMSLRAWLVGRAITGAVLKDRTSQDLRRMAQDACIVADAAIAKLMVEE